MYSFIKSACTFFRSHSVCRSFLFINYEFSVFDSNCPLRLIILGRRTARRKRLKGIMKFEVCTLIFVQCFLMHQSVLFRLHNFTFANSSRNISSDISISIHFLCNLSVRFHGQSTAGHSNRGLKRPTFLAM